MQDETLKVKVEAYVQHDKAEKDAKVKKDEARPCLIDEARNILEKGEKTVVLEGISGDVQVAFKEKLDIYPDGEFIEIYNSGKYPQIRKTVTIGVLPEHSEAVISALVKAGLVGLVTISESYDFDSKKKIASKDLDEDLKKVVKISESPTLTVKGK